MINKFYNFTIQFNTIKIISYEVNTECSGMIKQVNQDIKHFKIRKPRVLDLPKKIDFGKS